MRIQGPAEVSAKSSVGQNILFAEVSFTPAVTSAQPRILINKQEEFLDVSQCVNSEHVCVNSCLPLSLLYSFCMPGGT